MPLGPKTAALFAQLAEQAKKNPPKSLRGLPIAEVREICVNGFGQYATPFPEGASESDFIPRILHLENGKKVSVQVYTPAGLNGSEPLSTFIYFYAGGYCLDLNIYQHGACARIAKAAQCQVIVVDYPLAPEHTAQYIVDTCYEAVRHLYQHGEKFNIDRENFSIGGCSSGATLAALVTNRSLTDHDLNITQQILITPLVDLTLKTHRESVYLDYQKQDLMLSDDALEYFVGTFATTEAIQKSSNISPLFQKDWRKLPDTLIIVGEYDALRGDGVSYAEVLKQAGQSVTLITCPGQTHCFFSCRAVLDDGEDPALIAADSIASRKSKSLD